MENNLNFWYPFTGRLPYLSSFPKGIMRPSHLGKRSASFDWYAVCMRRMSLLIAEALFCAQRVLKLLSLCGCWQ